ncbi:fructan hydrolase [Spiroplasma litorale]|uniref:Fructan hydrolase n=1 Tax=Spiroplasma litorale TaxID=216942 RepID=A0A0K1W250_9MOLU|nr:glycoside hydrolase family 32 protein [Spiroplasma litorale]AKX34177.1 fructan hydrolase [Spiroplasma litorale]
MKKVLSILSLICLSGNVLLSSISCTNNNTSNKEDANKEVENLTKINLINGSRLTSPNYNERYYNKFHVDTPDKKGMLNDMQGAWFDGTYWHLYFLYNSEANYNENGEQIGKNGTEWFHMQTKDFVNYEYKGLAVKKWNSKGWGDAAGGTLFIDKDGDFNVKNLKNGRVSISTGYGGEKGQNILAYYSNPGENGEGNDFGYNFNPLNDSEPILKNNQPEGTYPDFRDPHFFKKDGKFIMYVSQLDKFGVYVSENPLKGYEHKGDYYAKHAMVECANLFELNVNGDKNSKKYIMIYGGNGNNDNGQPEFIDNLGTGTYYSIGHLNENFVFVEEQGPKRLDFGADFYAAKFFEDTKENDDDLGKYLIGTGWMSSWDYNRIVPNTGYWGNMSLARKILLVKNDEGIYSLKQSFIDNENLESSSYGNESFFVDRTLKGGSYKLDLEFKNTDKSKGIINLVFNDETYKNTLKLDFNDNQISTYRSSLDETIKNNNGFIQKRKYSANINKLNKAKISLYVDTTSIEAIMPDGSTISLVKFPDGKSVEKLTLESSTKISFNYDYYQY